MHRWIIVFLLGVSLLSLLVLPAQTVYGTTDLSSYGTVLQAKTYQSPYSGHTWTMTWFQSSQNPHDQQKVLFDTTGTPVTMAQMRAVEDAAFFAKHGTFDPELEQALRTKQLDDEIDVDIWFKDAHNRQVPIDITPDPNITVIPDIPLTFARLTKRDLLQLRNHESISTIYMRDDTKLSIPQTPIMLKKTEQHAPDMYSAVRTQYIPDLWANGWTGHDITIGIVEGDKVQAIPEIELIGTQPYCDQLPISDEGVKHATRVASIASSHVEPKGIAPEASILSACPTTDPSTMWNALDWVFSHGADIANISVTDESSTGRNELDTYTNAIARKSNKFITVASGNITGNVGSPGKAWNVLTVGAFYDYDTLKWSDDTMMVPGIFGIDYISGYINPQSWLNEHEKPEVVAVGLVSTYQTGSNIVGSVGTSNASPQVAGLAALLMNRDPNLKNAPLAIRSIIMAGAVHNIRDIHYIPSKSGNDYWDGAGAIVGTASANAATQYDPWPVCTYSCWFNLDMPYDANNQEQVVFRKRFFVEPGDRVRIVANWWAPEQPYHLNTVATDYDLVVRNPQGGVVATSNSADNNYEMVDFYPVLTDLSPNGHLFTMEIVQYDSVELNGNTLGIAAYVYRPSRSTFSEPVHAVQLPLMTK